MLTAYLFSSVEKEGPCHVLLKLVLKHHFCTFGCFLWTLLFAPVFPSLLAGTYKTMNRLAQDPRGEILPSSLCL